MAPTKKSAKLFVRNFFITFLGLLVAIAGCVVVIDPFENLHLSPDLERSVISQNQRFGYPALARSGRFDSAIFGTSTLRMINPTHIDGPLGARFANLSMNSGTWWEQRELFRVFSRHHSTPKRIMIGLDKVWCSEKTSGDKLTHRQFPPWIYDDNPWNDYLHILNFRTAERAGEQFAYLIGANKGRFGRNGYRSLNKAGTPYDLEKARRKIYGRKDALPPAPALSAPEVSEAERDSWTFPDLQALEEMVSALSGNTEILLIFVPYHHYLIGAPLGRTHIKYEACKSRVREIKKGRANVRIMDFMIRSDFTLEDRNYWDALHFNDTAARRIERAIVEFWLNGTQDPQLFAVR